MTENPLISFIIPVYNTSINRLNKCLNSILQISKLRFEIILVNDGSKKKYTNQYIKFVNKYSKLKYIYEDNKEVSSARNKGISVAKGKYIFFVDSDDAIDSSAFSSKLKNMQSDLIIFNVTVKTKKTIKKYSLNSRRITELSKNFLFKTSIKNGLINWSFGKLYKRSVLQQNNIYFDKNKKTGEDLEFVIKVVIKSKTIEYLPLNSYYYYLSKDTSYSRYSRYPIQIINDTLAIYKFRRSIVARFYNQSKQKEYICLGEDVVQSLFNVYIMQQNPNMQIYYKIIRIINDIPYKDSFNLVSKIRMYILFTNNKILLAMYKLLLKIHIKITKDN